MIGMEVRSAANGASAVCAAVRGAAVAVSRFNCAAAIAPAGAGVGVVAVGRPIAPDVAENAVFSAAFLAGFARGAGGRFGAAGVFKYTTMIIRTARALLFRPASYTFNNCLIIVQWSAGSGVLLIGVGMNPMTWKFLNAPHP